MALQNIWFSSLETHFNTKWILHRTSTNQQINFKSNLLHWRFTNLCDENKTFMTSSRYSSTNKFLNFTDCLVPRSRFAFKFFKIIISQLEAQQFDMPGNFKTVEINYRLYQNILDKLDWAFLLNSIATRKPSHRQLARFLSPTNDKTLCQTTLFHISPVFLLPSYAEDGIFSNRRKKWNFNFRFS